jgi:hypothetical protein
MEGSGAPYIIARFVITTILLSKPKGIFGTVFWEKNDIFL